MDLSNSKDESLLHYYESVRRQVDADRKSGPYRFAGHGVKQYADRLREEMDRRRLRFRPIDWPQDLDRAASSSPALTTSK